MKGERNPQGMVLPQPFLSLTPIRGPTDIGTVAPLSVYLNVRLNLRIIRAWRWSFASGDLSRTRLRLL